MSGKFAVFETIGAVFDAFKAKFFPLLGWLILPFFALIPIFALFGFVFGGSIFLFIQSIQMAAAFGNPSFLFFGGSIILVLVLFYLVLILFGAWYGIYASRLGYFALIGQPLQPGDARKRGFGRMIPSLLVTFVILVAEAAAIGLAVLVFIGLAATGAIGVLIAILLAIVFFVAWIYVVLGLSAVTPVMANEGLGFSALTRSWNLVSGNRWQLIGYNLMWMLILVGFYLVFLILIFTGALTMALSVVLGILILTLLYLAFICVMVVFGGLVAPAAYLGLLKAEKAVADPA